MEELVHEFILNAREYLKAKNKQKINEWANYLDSLSQYVEAKNGFHYGFYVCESILRQYGKVQGLELEVFLLAAQCMKTICCKKELLPQYQIDLIKLIDYLITDRNLSTQNPIVLQLTLSFSGMFFHRMIQRISSHYVTYYSQLLFTELTKLFQEIVFPGLSINPAESGVHPSKIHLLFLILQFLSEFFAQKDIKFWIAYRGIEKNEIIKFIQVSFLELSSKIFPYFLKFLEEGVLQRALNDIERMYFLTLIHEWIKNLNAMDIFLIAPSASKNKNDASVVIPLDTSLRTLSYWMEDQSLVSFLFQILQHAISTSSLDLDNESFVLATELLGQFLEFYHLVLRHTNFELFALPADHPHYSALSDLLVPFLQVAQSFSKISFSIGSINRLLQQSQTARLQQAANSSAAELLDTVNDEVFPQLEAIIRPLSESSTDFFASFSIIQSTMTKLSTSPLAASSQQHWQEALGQLHLGLLDFFSSCDGLQSLVFNVFFQWTNNSIPSSSTEFSFSSCFELFSLGLEIWQEMVNSGCYDAIQSFRSQQQQGIELPDFSSFLVQCLQITSFRGIRQSSNLRDRLHEMNEFRGELRDFFRDVLRPSLFDQLASIAIHAADDFRQSSASAVDGSAMAEKTLWLETTLHALSSICKDKLKVGAVSHGPILQLWAYLVEPSLLSSRVICRIAVILISEFMKYFVELELLDLQADRSSLLDSSLYERLIVLFPQSYRALLRSLSHPEKFPRDQRPAGDLEKWISFRVKQDHIGAVALQKALDFLLSSYGRHPSPLSQRHRISSFMLGYLFSFDQIEQTWTVPSFPSLLAGLSRNEDGRLMVLDMLRVSFSYLLAYTQPQAAGMALHWTSFSIVFHAFCHLLTFPALPQQAQGSAAVVQNDSFWIILAPTLLALLSSSSSPSSEEFRGALFAHLLPPAGNEEARSLLLALAQQFSHCSLDLLLSVLVESVRFLYHSFEYWRLSSVEQPQLVSSYLAVLGLLQRFLGCFLQTVQSMQCAPGSLDLLDDVIDLAALFFYEVWSFTLAALSSSSSAASPLVPLLRDSLSSVRQQTESLLDCFSAYCTAYEVHQVHKKKAINSIFRLVITLKKCFPGDQLVHGKIQNLFHSFSSLGMEAVRAELSGISSQSSETSEQQNVFKVGLERESKKSLAQSQQLQSSQNLFLLLKFWNYSFDLIVPKPVVDMALPSSTNSSTIPEESQAFRGSGKQKKGGAGNGATAAGAGRMTIRRLEIVKDIVEDSDDQISWGIIDLATISSVLTILCESICPPVAGQSVGRVAYSSQIWRMMIACLHTLCGKLKAAKSSSSQQQKNPKECQGKHLSVRVLCVFP
jgi:hypothetical protein